MPQIQPPPPSSPTLHENIRAIAYTREAWTDDWTYARYLQPITWNRSVAPSVAHAEFQHRFGVTRYAGESDYSVTSPLDLIDHYVQIRLITTTGPSATAADSSTPSHAVWTGRFTSESIAPHGSDAGYAQGDQQISAWGLEHALDQEPITTARAQIGGATTEIQRAPEINGMGRWGTDRPGNRSSSVGDDGVYVYSSDGAIWTARQYLDYLLEYHQPESLTFELAGQLEILDYVYPRHQVEGVTVWQVIEHLIPRQRGIGWLVEVRGDTIALVVDTIFGQEVSVGDVTIPANSLATDLDWSNDPRVQQPQIGESHTGRYDRIRVRGARIVSCFSAHLGTTGLERGWTDADETAYEAATREERDEDVHDRTYRTYRIRQDWTWGASYTASDFTGTVTTASPAADPDGGIDDTTTVAQWLGGKALLRWIPIPESADADGADPERRKPFAWASYVVDGATRKVRLDAGHPDSDLAGMGLRIRDSELSFDVEADPAHLLALNHLDPDTLTDDQQVEQDPVIDYNTLGVTVAVELDQRLEVIADLPGAPATDPRTLTVDVPDAQYWHIAPGTVAAISDGETESFEGYTFDHGDIAWATDPIRDDTDRLREVAALAKSWYGRPRRSVSFTLQALSSVAPLGAYVTAAFSATWQISQVGTCVTEIQWDAEAGTTTYRTDYQEIDLQRMVEFPGLSFARGVARTVRRHETELRALRERTANLPTRRVSAAGGRPDQIDLTFDGSGSVVSVGAEAYVPIQRGGKIAGWQLDAEDIGSVTVDVWVADRSDHRPPDSDSITGGDEPAISSDDYARSSDVSAWSDIVLRPGAEVRAHVDSCSDITKFVLTLEVV